jgi:uncharacterized protein
MRRKDKEITSKKEIEKVIRSSLVCRLAMADHDQPYIVPLCFGLAKNALYFHCAPEGRKLEILRNNPSVCFEFDSGVQLVPGKKPCDIGMKYKSVIGSGIASVVSNEAERKRGLRAVVRQYSKTSGAFSPQKLARTLILKVDILEMTGKSSQKS